MSFLTPMLLAGAALIAVPIALHLARRKQPVREVFPAMRLLRKNRHRNEARLRLRRWLLLALRCAAVALLALALARPLLLPTTPEGEAAPAGPAGLAAAVAVVLDNAPNSAYQQLNQTRLDRSREAAAWLLEKLPADTTVILADRSLGGSAAVGDPVSAQRRVERVAVANATRSLGVAARDALARLADSPAGRREAYLFTDLSAGAWDAATRDAVAIALDKSPGVVLRLYDAGAAKPHNAGVVSIDLSGESLTVGEPLRIEATIDLTGEWDDPLTVQLWLDTKEGPVKRDERVVDPPATGDTVEAAFSLSGLEEGVHTGHVRVVAGDALQVDDLRHFGFEVRAAPSLLIAAEQEADAVFFRSAVAPEAAAAGVAPRFSCRVVHHSEWGPADLAAADAALLLDPPPLGGGDRWRALYDYATSGGAVALFLGREATLDAFNSPDAQALLPARLRWRSREETYLRPTDYSHPTIRSLAPYAEAIAWRAFPVQQHWELGELVAGAEAVVRYSDGSPALVERSVGRGRVIVMTTPVSDRLNRPDVWNLLPTGESPWPFVLLANSIADRLVGRGEERLNYTAGQTVAAPLPPGFDQDGFVLRTPDGSRVRQSVPPGADRIAISSAREPGVYSLEAGGERALIDRRFAVNLDPSVSRLERVPFEQLEERFGEDRVRLISTREQLAKTIDLGTIGQELYGWLLPLVAAAFAAEQVVSNRFYRQSNA